MNIYMFDVDETLEVSGGPVKFNQLVSLREHGHILGLCGNWAMVTNYVQGWHTLFSLVSVFKGRKYEYLEMVKKHIPADRYIMVGNEFPSNAPYSDKGEAELAGWEFIHEKDFAEMMA